MTLSKRNMLVAMLASLTLAGCSTNNASTSGNNVSDTSTAKVEQVETKEESQAETKETSAVDTSASKESDSPTTSSETLVQPSSTVDHSVKKTNGVDVSAMANGDYSSLVGTWTDKNGTSIIVNSQTNVSVISNGVRADNYHIKLTMVDNGILYGGLVSPEGYGLGSFMIIPAGIATPFNGVVYQEDVISHGQTANADLEPFFKALN